MEVFCDIDGTLTTEPLKRWGPVVPEAIERLKSVIASGANVILWSGGGREYARQFAEKYGIEGTTTIGKPDVIIDDNFNIRPKRRMTFITPKDFAASGIPAKVS